jgi:hypothetical protein
MGHIGRILGGERGEGALRPTLGNRRRSRRKSRSPQLSAGGFVSRDICEPVLTDERKLSLARQGGLTNIACHVSPRLKTVGYGSYAGFADGTVWRTHMLKLPRDLAAAEAAATNY